MHADNISLLMFLKSLTCDVFPSGLVPDVDGEVGSDGLVGRHVENGGVVVKVARREDDVIRGTGHDDCYLGYLKKYLFSTILVNF